MFIAFCIELIPQGNEGDGILILRNDVVESTIRSRPHFTSTQKTCWNDFDFENDIIELRYNGCNDAVTFHVNLINEGVSTKLLFGLNADIDWIALDSDYNWGAYGDDGLYCIAHAEAAHAIKIQNGKIIESECVKPRSIPEIKREYSKLLLNRTQSRIKKEVNFDFPFDYTGFTLGLKGG